MAGKGAARGLQWQEFLRVVWSVRESNALKCNEKVEFDKNNISKWGIRDKTCLKVSAAR